MRIHLTLTVAVGLLTSVVHAAGFVHNENFIVLTEPGVSPEATQEFAQALLAKAEEYRRQIALDWLGEELPPGVGRTSINVFFSDHEDSGTTWAMDGSHRPMHTVYLRTSADRALGHTLQHEMAHVVLATYYPHPHRLPAWVEEGVASHYDSDERRHKRDSLLRFWARRKNWPSVEGVLNRENISAEDVASYAVAVSLSSMLLADGGKKKFLECAETASRDGWPRALAHFYQIRDAGELQQQWQDWVGGSRDATTRLSRASRSSYGQ
jgi:hypothetical protein